MTCRLAGVTVLAFIIATGGCSRFGLAEEADPLIVAFSMNKAEYRPGEAAIVEVAVRNAGETPVQIRRLDAQSVELAYTRFGDNETPVFRPPVHPKADTLGQMVTVEPGNEIRRKFVFTTLTQFNGPMSAQVHYDPNPAGSHQMGTKRYTEVGHYEVKGPRMFRRDAAGLIDDGDAVALARRVTQSPVSGGKAIFYEDKDTGLYVIWINLDVTRTGADGRVVTAYEAYIVDPYLGEVMNQGRQVRPFNPAQAEDPRFRRPAGLPPRGSIPGMAQPPASAVPAPEVPATAPPQTSPAPANPAAQPPAATIPAPQPPVQQAPPPAMPPQQQAPAPAPTPYVSPQTQAPATAPPAGGQ